MKNPMGWRGAALGAVCLLSLAACRPTQMPASGQLSGATGEEALFPDFKVKTLDNSREVSLVQYRGKIVILDLFATWCPPCRMEIPHLVALQNAYQGKLAVVGLSYDQASAETVQKFAEELKINYDVYWGSEEIARHVGLRGIPHLLILDSQGRVRRSAVGYQEKEVLEKDIQALLKSSQP